MASETYKPDYEIKHTVTIEASVMIETFGPGWRWLEGVESVKLKADDLPPDLLRRIIERANEQRRHKRW